MSSVAEKMPLWDAMPEAIRRFNLRESLPRTAWPFLRLLLGLERLPDRATPVVFTFSVFEDFARVWHRFVMAATNGKWQVVIGDSSGAMDPAKFPGARLVRVPNRLYHGRKIDLFLRRVLSGQSVFLCDDDMYPLFDPTPHLARLAPKDVAAVSLWPRPWFQFEVDGKRHDPMGSFALLFKPETFFREGLRFQPPVGIESTRKVFAEGAKRQRTYDTGDYANEQFLLRGYRVETERHDGFIGFDGMTGPRLLLKRRGKAWVKRALTEADHYKDGSVNGAVLKAMLCSAPFERLYREAFGAEPEVVSGFTAEELAGMIDANPRIAADDRARLHAYARQAEETGRVLIKRLAHV